MRITVNKITDKLAWLLTVALLASFVIFIMESWGRYIYISLAAAILLVSVLGNRGKLIIQIKDFHLWAITFSIFTFISSLWAVYSASAARTNSTTLLLTFICAAMVYVHYQGKEDIHSFLTAVMWAGYVVAVYTLIYYGYDTLKQMAAESSSRMENEYANVNSIGMIVSLACVLQVNELSTKKNYWSAVMMIPAVVVIAATQSRKAFVMLIGGALAIMLLRSLQDKSKGKALLRFTLVVIVAIIGLRCLLDLPIFAGVLDRMEGLIENLTGTSEGGSSAALRSRMRELGWDLFTKYPVVGVGMNNPQYFAGARLMFFAYLHNNYVEILAGGGAIGFILYYVAHTYILVSLFKYRKADWNSFLIGIIWMGIILVMDYGMVSYSEKTHLFYMMFHFLNVEAMKRKYRSMYHECAKIH